MLLSVSHPRINNAAKDVNKNRDEYDDETEDYDRALNEGVVLNLYRVYEKPSHTVPVESRLRKDRSGEEYREL